MVIAKRSEGGQFELPPQGLHQAVCIDVLDIGVKDTSYGPKHRVTIRWALDANDSTGRQFWAHASYNLTLGSPNKPSALCQMIETWRGAPMSDEEFEQFNLDSLIGMNCQMQIVHKMGDGGKNWANVQAVVPLGRGAVPMRIPEDYVRKTPF